MHRKIIPLTFTGVCCQKEEITKKISKEILDTAYAFLPSKDKDVLRSILGELLNNVVRAHREKKLRSKEIICSGEQCFKGLEITVEMSKDNDFAIIVLKSNISAHQTSTARVSAVLLSSDEGLDELMMKRATQSAEDSYVSATGSAGIGLIMMRREIEAIGGKIEFDLRTSGFIITIPVKE